MRAQSKHTLVIVTALFLLAMPIATDYSNAYAQQSSQTFPETGKTITGRFLQYWQEHGGLAQQGYPISDVIGEMSDTNGVAYTVQYFERAVFEYHPENNAPNDILLSLLGNFAYQENYISGAPNATPNTAANSRLFAETGKRLGGTFQQYWNTHGGLAQQGFPISDEFAETSPLDGKQYTVQYFERAVFEYHPENPKPNDVLLSQLGTFRFQAKYPSGATFLPSPQSVPPAIPTAAPTKPPTASNPPKSISAFATYIQSKHRQIGSCHMTFEEPYMDETGSHYLALYMDSDSSRCVNDKVTRSQLEDWGDAVFEEAKQVWPNEPFDVSLKHDTYTKNLPCVDCDEECYYYSPDYDVSRGWYVVYTFVHVYQDKYEDWDVITCD